MKSGFIIISFMAWQVVVSVAGNRPAVEQNEETARLRLRETIQRKGEGREFRVVRGTLPDDIVSCDEYNQDGWIPIMSTNACDDRVPGASFTGSLCNTVADVPADQLISIRVMVGHEGAPLKTPVSMTAVVVQTGIIAIMGEKYRPHASMLDLLNGMLCDMDVGSDIVQQVRRRILRSTSLDIIHRCYNYDALLKDNDTKPLDELLFDAVLALYYPGPAFAQDCYETQYGCHTLHAYIEKQDGVRHVAGVQVFFNRDYSPSRCW
jgi:hypothetical protein